MLVYLGSSSTTDIIFCTDFFSLIVTMVKVEDVMFVNNTDATEWSADGSDEGGSDLVVLSSSTSGIAEGSTAVLTDVTCSAQASSSSTCTVIVDEENFDLSTESVACGVCNLDGTAANSTVADIDR